MRRNQRNEVLAGGFILASLGLLVLLFVLKGAVGELLRPTGDVRVVLEDIRGLSVGDPVFFLGSKAGQVGAIEFARQPWGLVLPDLFPGETGETTRVFVTLRLDRTVRRHLRADSPVEIDKNLTGNISVLIHEGKGERLPELGAVLKGRPGVELGALAEKVDAMLRKFDPAVEDFARLAKRLGRSEDLDSSVRDVAHLARRLREGIGPLLRNLDEAVSEARALLGENRAALRAASSELAEGAGIARRLIEKVEPAASDLKGALSQVEKAGAAVAGTVESQREALRDIVEDARSAAASAANFAADIRRRPWRLLHRPSRSEEETRELYDAAWAYNRGAAELDRSLRDLKARMAAEPPGGPASEALRQAEEKVQESLRRHGEVERAFWARLEARE